MSQIASLPSGDDRLQLEGAITAGNWGTETESVAAFDDAVEATGRFIVYREVKGSYQWLRPNQEMKTPRIDRILFPTKQLADEGWNLGPVAVECKRSGAKTGPPIAQLLDYSHAVWEINHTWVMPQWYLLWPISTVKSTLESMFSQQRLGGIYLDHRGRLVLHSRSVLAKFDGSNSPDLRLHNTVAGRKTGSR